MKPESIEAFKEATRANAEASRREPGVARFDVLQDQDDPTRFQFIEVYRSREAHAAHRETAHYARWRDAVAAMMASPRTATKLTNLSPGDEGW